jgi:hypothetical protein
VLGCEFRDGVYRPIQRANGNPYLLSWWIKRADFEEAAGGLVAGDHLELCERGFAL